ncbi:MBL fold metallo-hydrolase [Arthrobacter sp. UCD-GKA]|nr:MBL fold metallo-hydrolase [Arthrobacter sp. UCD-GKA]
MCTRPSRRSHNVDTPFELITLGTAAGPAIRGHEDGIASALRVEDSFYMVDFGLGATRAAHEAGLRGKNFRAGFITHLHSDHVVELPAFLLWNWGAPVDGFTSPIDILGPGQDPGHPRGKQLSGTMGMVQHCLDAYSYDVDIRITDEARPNLREIVRAREIEVPHPDSIVPFDVYEDDLVKVTAVLVKHPPIFPALAFRFDTAYGSVTFSGDTAESEALAILAQDTDVLVHEAVNLDFYRAQDFSPAFINHQMIAHTSPEGAGRVAASSGARSLVLSHLAGIATPEQWKSRAEATYSGKITVATSGQRFALNKVARPESMVSGM